MKIFLTLLTVCVMIFAAGCNTEPAKKVGLIRHMNMTEEAFDKLSEQADNVNPQHEKVRHIFFNSMTEMTAALQSGQIDELATYEVVGRYLAAQNPNFDLLPHDPKIADAFCCAMREQDAALKKEFNDAMDAIIADGTLSKLVKVYILDAFHTAPTEIVDLPTFYSDEFDEDYAPTIKIGVTGDLPPLDYVRADGQAAGFNTALLAEISNRMKRNFQIIPIDGGARSVALTSKLVDVIFWVIVPTYDEFPIDIDKPAGIILTDPYFTDEIVHVKLKQ
ncbi:MAG: transporter substrate-binding domain-containing protein [Selenomonadaceae bacterium]|nr:transporter substrate-binding domain-containing protein [Selenomonadaceae bacterium]